MTGETERTVGPEKRTAARPVVAILGGGLSGAATAFHLARALSRGEAEIVVVEPRPLLGRGLAYGTEEPAHRLNVPAERLSLLPPEPRHFMQWIAARGIELSPGSLGPAGGSFPERRIFGQYVSAQMAPLLASGAVRHRRASATAVVEHGAGYRVSLSDGEEIEADLVVLAMTHPGPAVPWPLRALEGSPRLIEDPYDNARIAAIGAEEEVLIVGACLTAADVIATLDRHGFRGRITAISRHGLRSRGHCVEARKSAADFALSPERTALGLLRRIRAEIAEARGRGECWHPTLDRLREQGSAIWAALPGPERARLTRHLRRFWDVHRFRVAPVVAEVLDRLIVAGHLRFVAGRIAEAREEGEAVTVSYRPRRGTASVSARFDRVVVTTGPDHAGVIDTNPALHSLADQGLVAPDPLGLGLRVEGRCRTVARDGTASETLLVAGPLARGDVGELMGVPEVVRHAEEVATLIARRVTGETTLAPEVARHGLDGSSRAGRR